MLTAEYVKTLLDYDPETGIFVWKVSRRKRLQGVKAGRISNKGYVQISIDDKRYSAHRLAWLVYYGEFPNGWLDHINRNKSDNRISNLRIATNQQNQFNQGLPSNNTSGFKGVVWNKNQGKWNAAMTLNGKRHHLGTFETKEEASAAYEKFAKEKQGDFMVSRAALAKGGGE